MLRSSPNKPSSSSVLHQHQQAMHPAHHQQAAHHNSVLSPSHHLPVAGAGGMPMFGASCDHPTLRLMAVAAAVAAAASGTSPASSASSSNNTQVSRHGQQPGDISGRQARDGGAAMSQLQPPPPGPNELYASYLYSRGQFDRAAMLHLMQQHHHHQQQQQQQQQHNPFTQSAAISSSSTSSSLSASQQHQHQLHQQQHQQQRNSQKIAQQQPHQSPLFQAGSAALQPNPTPAHHAHSAATSSPEYHRAMDAAAGIASLPLPPPPYHLQQQKRAGVSPQLVGSAAAGAPAGFESYSQSLATLSQLSQRLHLHEHLQQAQPYPAPSSLSLSRQHGMMMPFGPSSSSTSTRVGPMRRDSVEDRSPPIIGSPPSGILLASNSSSSSRSPMKSRSRSIPVTDEEAPVNKFRENRYVFDADEPSPPSVGQHATDVEFSRLERGRPNGISENQVLHSARHQEHLQRRNLEVHSAASRENASDLPRRCNEAPYFRQLSKDVGSYDDSLNIASSASKRHDTAEDVRKYHSGEIQFRHIHSLEDESDRRKAVCNNPNPNQLAAGSGNTATAARDWQSALYSRSKDDDRACHLFARRKSLPEASGHRSSTSSTGSGAVVTSRAAEATAERQFYVKGSVIQLSGGRVKRVEDLDTDDFQIGSSMVDEDDAQFPDCSSGEGDEDDDDDDDVDSETSISQRCAADDEREDEGPLDDDVGDTRRSLEEQSQKNHRKRSGGVDDGRTGSGRTKQRSRRLVVEASRVVHMRQNHDTGTAVLGFAVGQSHAQQVSVEVSLDHPFFVCGLGWSSCCPERTLQHYGLACRRLAIGDTCVSLLRQQQQRGRPSLAPSRVGYSQSRSNASAATSPTMTSSASTVAGGHHHHDNCSKVEHMGVSTSDNRATPEIRGTTLESTDPDFRFAGPKPHRRADDGDSTSSNRVKQTEHSSAKDMAQRSTRKRHWSDDDVTDNGEPTSLQSTGRDKQLRAATSGGCCRDTTSGSDMPDNQVDYCNNNSNNNNNNNGKDTITMAPKAK